MKIRTDFVTNSSSSSFVIAKHNLDEDQIAAIHCHVEMMEKLGLIPEEDYSQAWTITESEHFISGSVFMDNLNISELFSKIQIPDSIVYWDDEEPDLAKLEQSFHRTYKGSKDSSWRELLHQTS